MCTWPTKKAYRDAIIPEWLYNRVEQEDFSNVSLRKVRRMNNCKKTLWVLLLVVALCIGMTAFSGCSKKSDSTAAPANEVTSTEIVQTVCPVMMGNAINKDIFVEYNGKKVYFCCAECKTAFEKEPEKYIAKLPQFFK